MSKTSMPANFLKSTALPSITGFEASGPMSPSPSTAVPFVITATRFARASGCGPRPDRPRSLRRPRPRRACRRAPGPAGCQRLGRLDFELTRPRIAVIEQRARFQVLRDVVRHPYSAPHLVVSYGLDSPCARLAPSASTPLRRAGRFPMNLRHRLKNWRNPHNETRLHLAALVAALRLLDRRIQLRPAKGPFPGVGARSSSIGRYCSIADKVDILLGGNHRIDWVHHLSVRRHARPVAIGAGRRLPRVRRRRDHRPRRLARLRAP